MGGLTTPSTRRRARGPWRLGAVTRPPRVMASVRQKNMTSGQEDLERGVMKLLLHGDLSVLEVLRQQYAASSTRSREYSGVGFFTYFAVPKDVAPSSPADF